MAQSRDLVKRILNNLPDKTTAGKLLDAIEVHAEWESRGEGLTPDRPELFGPELAGEWASLRSAVITALNDSFPYGNRSQDPVPSRKTYEKTAAEFQRKLYAKLR